MHGLEILNCFYAPPDLASWSLEMSYPRA